MCNVSSGRSRQHCIGCLFSCKNMFLRPWTNIAWVIFLCNVVLGVFKQHWLDNSPMHYCSSMVNRSFQRLYSSWKLSVSPGTTLDRKKSCPMLSKRLQTILHRKNPVKCCLKQYFWDNIPQVKTLCNVQQEAPENNAQEKILFNVVLILLG